MINNLISFRKNKSTKKDDDDPTIRCINDSSPIACTTNNVSHGSPSSIRTKLRNILLIFLPRSRNWNTSKLPHISKNNRRFHQTHHSYHHRSSKTSPCSNFFLMGGGYYPPKNKYREVRKRKRNMFFYCFIFLFSITMFYYYSRNGSAVRNRNHIKRRHSSKFHLPLFHGKKDDVSILKQMTSSWSFELRSIKEMKDIYYNSNLHDKTDHDSLHSHMVLNEILSIVPEYAHRNDGDFFSKKAKTESENDFDDYNDYNSEKDDNYGKEDTDEMEQNENEKIDFKGKTKTLKNMITNSSCPRLSSTNEISVSLVFQCTIDRLWLIKITCSQRWKESPIILVLFLPKNNNSTQQVQELQQSCPNVNIIKFEANEELEDYPINKLRNLGLDAVKTTHYLVLDADFIPSKFLMKNIIFHGESLLKDDSIFIVPAFERSDVTCTSTKECQLLFFQNDSFIPDSFTQLKSCFISKKCFVFQEKNNWEGHFTTKSLHWIHSNTTLNTPRPIKCFHSPRYEPYVLMRHCQNKFPYYDERFKGYGKNKISYIMHLRFLNYTFFVLPQGFIVHFPHPESKIKQIWNKPQSQLHHNMDTLYPKFIHELQMRYSNLNIPTCQTEKSNFYYNHDKHSKQ